MVDEPHREGELAEVPSMLELVVEQRRGQDRLCPCHLGKGLPAGRSPPTTPVLSPTGSAQQGEEALHRGLSGDWEVPTGARDLCGCIPSQQSLGTGQDCFWGQGTGQDGGGLCEYGLLPSSTGLWVSVSGTLGVRKALLKVFSPLR